MASTTRPRRTIAAALALLLAAETLAAVAVAANSSPVTHPLPPDPPVGEVLAAETDGAAVGPPPAPAAAGAPQLRILVMRAADTPDLAKPLANPAAPVAAPSPAPRAEREAGQEATKASRAAARPAARTSANPAAAPTTEAAPRTYRGTNRVWIPELGISRSVSWFPCERQRPPDNLMYRWGCAGANNVYLMGHAYSVMKPLHDAYVRGRLHKGMKAWYADGKGKVRVFAVRWWKVTLPTPDAAWAWAPQEVSSMTLQTCVGKDSQYRLMVRLVEVKG